MQTNTHDTTVSRMDGMRLHVLASGSKGNCSVVENRFVGNTTLGVIITNAAFAKPALCKIAGVSARQK